MRVKNVIAVPPFYSGTSFVDIVENLRRAVAGSSLALQFIGSAHPLENKLAGDFLDNKEYVLGQQKLIQELINFGKVEKILFLDFFNPGLSLLRYFHEQQQYTCTYGALLHGGTFLNHDLYSWQWLKNVEIAWGDIYNSIYASSLFLKKGTPPSFRKKVKVFPWGMDVYRNSIPAVSKDIDVIFPFRLNSDKGVDDFLTIATALPRVGFVVTVPQSKQVLQTNGWYQRIRLHKNIKFIDGQYGIKHLQTLARAKIILSCAQQETFGYAVMKAVGVGCIPIVPNRVCYPEFFNRNFLYQDTTQAIRLITDYLSGKGSDPEHSISLLKEKIRAFSFQPLLEHFFRSDIV